jgi:hypothetical protein
MRDNLKCYISRIVYKITRRHIAGGRSSNLSFIISFNGHVSKLITNLGEQIGSFDRDLHFPYFLVVYCVPRSQLVDKRNLHHA